MILYNTVIEGRSPAYTSVVDAEITLIGIPHRILLLKAVGTIPDN